MSYYPQKEQISASGVPSSYCQLIDGLAQCDEALATSRIKSIGTLLLNERQQEHISSVCQVHQLISTLCKIVHSSRSQMLRFQTIFLLNILCEKVIPHNDDSQNLLSISTFLMMISTGHDLYIREGINGLIHMVKLLSTNADLIVVAGLPNLLCRWKSFLLEKNPYRQLISDLIDICSFHGTEDTKAQISTFKSRIEPKSYSKQATSMIIEQVKPIFPSSPLRVPTPEHSQLPHELSQISEPTFETPALSPIPNLQNSPLKSPEVPSSPKQPASQPPPTKLLKRVQGRVPVLTLTSITPKRSSQQPSKTEKSKEATSPSPLPSQTTKQSPAINQTSPAKSKPPSISGSLMKFFSHKSTQSKPKEPDKTAERSSFPQAKKEDETEQQKEHKAALSSESDSIPQISPEQSQPTISSDIESQSSMIRDLENRLQPRQPSPVLTPSQTHNQPEESSQNPDVSSPPRRTIVKDEDESASDSEIRKKKTVGSHSPHPPKHAALQQKKGRKQITPPPPPPQTTNTTFTPQRNSKKLREDSIESAGQRLLAALIVRRQTCDCSDRLIDVFREDTPQVPSDDHNPMIPTIDITDFDSWNEFSVIIQNEAHDLSTWAKREITKNMVGRQPEHLTPALTKISPFCHLLPLHTRLYQIDASVCHHISQYSFGDPSLFMGSSQGILLEKTLTTVFTTVLNVTTTLVEMEYINENEMGQMLAWNYEIVNAEVNVYPLHAINPKPLALILSRVLFLCACALCGVRKATQRLEHVECDPVRMLMRITLSGHDIEATKAIRSISYVLERVSPRESSFGLDSLFIGERILWKMRADPPVSSFALTCLLRALTMKSVPWQALMSSLFPFTSLYATGHLFYVHANDTEDPENSTIFSANLPICFNSPSFSSLIPESTSHALTEWSQAVFALINLNPSIVDDFALSGSLRHISINLSSAALDSPVFLPCCEVMAEVIMARGTFVMMAKEPVKHVAEALSMAMLCQNNKTLEKLLWRMKKWLSKLIQLVKGKDTSKNKPEQSSETKSNEGFIPRNETSFEIELVGSGIHKWEKGSKETSSYIPPMIVSALTEAGMRESLDFLLSHRLKGEWKSIFIWAKDVKNTLYP
ncbi:hypothetical protein BLNAU_4413 [Blattamonas nauphoetae]|uniref:Telomere-associated protein Rif1 N-terminal domain-containing protein n=1 Tax=Blattamonas nauphoetae TaxID=2049346 RepID=A0ABQ9Y9Z4_9EUKA|nr:hypothetical protein BLNAU_4413 [Blattamonas nauphoetae]